MKRNPVKSLAIGAALALLAVSLGGCHGKADSNQSGIAAGPAVSPAEIQAKQQAQLNNPRVSPAMKAMLQKQLQQKSGNGTP